MLKFFLCSRRTPAQKIFSRIYRRNEWLSGSGEGSLPAATIEYRAFLQDFLRKYPVKSVVDIGCGDWQFSRFIDWSGVSYTGIDVVPKVIRENERCFSSGHIRFVEQDVFSEQPPPADLLILKDVLQHWRTRDILSFLPHLSRHRFALITNDLLEHEEYVGTVLGGYCPLDLREPPFSLECDEVFRFPYQTLLEGGRVITKVTFLIDRDRPKRPSSDFAPLRGATPA